MFDEPHRFRKKRQADFQSRLETTSLTSSLKKNLSENFGKVEKYSFLWLKKNHGGIFIIFSENL